MPRSTLSRSQRLALETQARIEESQTLLVNFLHIDVRIGHSLLGQAVSSHDPYRHRRAIAMASRALVAVRRLMERVHDPVERERIEGEADGLKQAIEAQRTSRYGWPIRSG